MSRNSYRGLTLVVVLIVGLGMALPAAAGPVERANATEDGLLARLWDWMEHLWQGVPREGGELRPATAANLGCETDPDRGILIDPNGNCVQ